MGLKKLFFPKTYKNLPAAGGFAPKPPLPPAAGGSAPRPPSVIRLSTRDYSTGLLSETIIALLTISFRPFSLTKSWLSDNRLRLQIFRSMISLPPQKVPF